MGIRPAGSDTCDYIVFKSIVCFEEAEFLSRVVVNNKAASLGNKQQAANINARNLLM